MTDFTTIPEALDHIAGQSWLSPDEPVRASAVRWADRSGAKSARIGWREAARQVLAVLRRI